MSANRTTPVREGNRTSSFGDSWENWWLFAANLTDAEVEEFCDENNIEWFYSHPGGTFSRGPSVRRSPGHTLITESGGYDV
jgi:hypothetical protein